jgi:hypothetical protein
MPVVHDTMYRILHTPVFSDAGSKANPREAWRELYGEAMKVKVFQAFDHLEIDLIYLICLDRKYCVAPI